MCFQSLLKLHNKLSYGASGFCEKYTRKTPLYIYYIISTGADAACIILAFWYYVGVLDRVRATKKRGTEHKRMNRTRSETREAGSIADGAQRDNTGRKIQMKWEVNRLKFVYKCSIVSAVIMAGFLLSALIR